MKKLMVKNARGSKNAEVKELLKHGWEIAEVIYYKEERCYITMMIKPEPEERENGIIGELPENITEVQEEELQEIFETRENKGLFLHYDIESYCYIAVDNTTGDAWTEEFQTKQKSIEWLLNN